MNNLMNNFKKKYYENKRLTDRLLIDLPIYFKKYCQDEKIYNEIEDKLIDLNICDCDAVHSGAKQRASSFTSFGGGRSAVSGDRRHRYTETREYFFKKIEDLSSYYNLIFKKYENTSYLYIKLLGEDSRGKYRFMQGYSGNIQLNSKIILIRECFNINVCEYKFKKFIDKHGYINFDDRGAASASGSDRFSQRPPSGSGVVGGTELEYGSNIFSIDGIKDLEKIMTKMKKICKENILEFKNTYTIKNYLEKKIELKNIEFEIKKLDIELSNTKSNRYTYTYTSDSDKIEDNVITSFFD
jgi:hypothetical protein